MRSFLITFCLSAAALTSPLVAQITMTPLVGFGGADGWLAPGENAFLGTANNERGFAYSSTTDHLYLVSRTNGTNVRIIDSVSGADLGALSTSGIAGGTFVLNKIVVGADGVIYGANLRTGTTGATFKLYRWDSETSEPVVIFDNIALGNGARIGDDLDAIGSGAATRIVAGYQAGGTPSPAGINGYAVIDPTASAPTPTTPSIDNVMFSTTPPNAGDFHQGITFLRAGLEGGTVLGTRGGAVSAARLTDYSGSTGTLLSTLTLQSSNERILDFTTVSGTDLLATVDTATNAVRLYDMTNPSAPEFLTMGNNTVGTVNTNANFAGDARFGDVVGNSVTLYAMNTNNGIQGFLITIPEPGTVSFLALAAIGLAFRRRR